MDQIEQGASYFYSFTVTGATGLGCEITVLRWPGDTPAIQRTIAEDGSGLIFADSLTPAETAALDPDTVYFIHGRLTDADEDIREPIPVKIRLSWVAQ